MAIIPSFNANATHIKLKNLSNTYTIPSQLIQEPTLSTNFPIPRLIESIKVKSGADPFSNARHLLGSAGRSGPVSSLEFKLFQGTVLIPHESRFYSDQGTRSVKGKVTINQDGKEIALDYEKVSLVNWPTFYPDDVVEFRVKFNESQTHFAVCDLMLKPAESFAKSGETRVLGTLYKYKVDTHNGMMICNDSQRATFRRDEILLDANYDLTAAIFTRRQFEFTLSTTSLGYLRALRILIK